METGVEQASDPEAKVALLMRLRAEGIRDLAVLRAMETVPRHAFAPAHHAARASREIALPIGCGQTMCRPVFVARLLEALACAPGSRVLVVGAGSGYTTALLSRVAQEVVAVERYRGLVEDARARLVQLAIGNATIDWEDGLAAVPAEGCFDRILVHAALDAEPERLSGRLAPGGVLVYPVRATARDSGLAPQRMIRLTREPLACESTVLPFGARLQAAEAGRAGLYRSEMTATGAASTLAKTMGLDHRI